MILKKKILSIDDLKFENIGHFYSIPYSSSIPDYLKKILNKYNKKDFLKINHFKRYYNDYNKEINCNKAPYKFKIIKNNKNQNSIYIKIQEMFYPTIDNYNDLKNFIIQNKNCENIYIDIRDNPGGFKYCYQLLLGIIFKGYIYIYDNN